MSGQSTAPRTPPTTFQLAAAAVAATIALTVLAGWASGLYVLTRVIPGAIAMNPVTAVTILALSAGLACRSARCAPLVRLLAWALHVPASDADGDLDFGKSLWDTDEPDLWRRDLTGRIVHWIDVGQPDERWGEVVHAVVSLRDPAATPEELLAFAAERVATYKKPRILTVWPELPKSPAGKILRREVRAELADP